MKQVKTNEMKKNGLFAKIHCLLSSRKSQHIEEEYLLFDEMEFAEPVSKKNLVKIEEEDVTEEVVEPVMTIFDEEVRAGITRPNNLIEQKALFPQDVDFINYCNELFGYFEKNGLMIEKNIIREIFSCIATSKMIILKNNDPIIRERFVELLSDFIGAFFFRDKLDVEISKFENLFVKDTLREALISANQYENTIHFYTLRDVNFKELDQQFEKIINYAWDPLIPCEIDDEYFSLIQEIPKNLWFFFMPEDNEESQMPLRLAQSAIVLELKAKIVQPQEEVYQNQYKLSYENFTNLLVEFYDQYYIEEEQWKNIDKIEEYLDKVTTFSIDNRLFRQLERYTSTFLMFGGDKYEAMDNILYLKLLPIISLLNLVEKFPEEESLFDLFEKLFGIEQLSRSKMFLKKMQEENR